MIAALAFYAFAAVLIGSAVMVVTSRNPVHSVLFLILAFFNAAGLFLIAGAEFLAMILVIVYVGAVAVLFLFVVMMLEVKMEELRTGIKTFLPLGLVVGLIMVAEMSFVLATSWGQVGPAADMGDDYNNTRALGESMYTEYAFAVEVGAVLLLVGMIAAISLTLRKRRDVKYSDPGAAVRVRASDRVRLVNVPSQEAVNAKAADTNPGEQK
jgi:NADH-quinone oxidoreductase subunit J